MMNKLINELFLRAESHVNILTDTGDYPNLLSDLKLFILMAGDLAIQVEDFESPPTTIEVSEEEAVRLGLIDSPDQSAQPVTSDDAEGRGMYV